MEGGSTVIELTHDNLILAFLVAAICMLAAVFFSILISSMIRSSQRKKTHMVCRLCGYHYLNMDKQKLTACPHCGGVNQRGSVKRH